VEVVRRAFAQFEQGNFWVPELFDADARVRWLDVVGLKSETVGLQSMSDFMRTWFEVHENLTMTAERLIDAWRSSRRFRRMARTRSGFRRLYGLAPCCGVDPAQREGDQHRGLQRPRFRPRSRRAAGVGLLRFE
jgi:hypothetical protein